MILYHYTDRVSGAEILTAKRIRASPITLYKGMHGKHSGETGFKTPPLVWLTINADLETTVYFKLIAMGWPEGLVNDLWRFVLPDEYAPLGLAEFAEAKKIDPSWWHWTVKSGEMVRSHYTAWRLHPRHIPLEDCTAVEVLTGYRPDHVPIWTPRPTT